MASLFYHKLGQGPPIMILPGLLGSTDNWRSISQQLAPHHTIYLVDHRNHGKSFHSDVMTYEAMAADVCELIAALGLTNIVLIGHSMGGKVAMQIAQTYPVLPFKLIIVDIAPRIYDMHRPAEILQALRQTPLQGESSRAEIDQHLSQTIPDPLIRAHCMKNLRRDKNKQLVWGNNVSVLADSIPHLAKEIPCLVPFEKPTLFVKGAESDYIQPRDHTFIQEMFPHYVLEEIPEAGHWVNHDQPQVLLRVIASFLQETVQS